MNAQEENELIEKFKNIKDEESFYKELMLLREKVKDLPASAETNLLTIAENLGIDISKYK